MGKGGFLIFLMEVRANSRVANNVNSTFSIRKFKKEEKLRYVINSCYTEFSHSSQPNEFTSQMTCLFCDIFIDKISMCGICTILSPLLVAVSRIFYLF